jgi:hypothetical protein
VFGHRLGSRHFFQQVNAVAAVGQAIQAVASPDAPGYDPVAHYQGNQPVLFALYLAVPDTPTFGRALDAIRNGHVAIAI